MSEIQSNYFSSFTLKGIKLNYLIEFIKICGGKEYLFNKTIKEISEEFIIPMTLWNENSFCEMLNELNFNEINEGIVGEANVYISYS